MTRRERPRARAPLLWLRGRIHSVCTRLGVEWRQMNRYDISVAKRDSVAASTGSSARSPNAWKVRAVGFEPTLAGV